MSATYIQKGESALSFIKLGKMVWFASVFFAIQGCGPSEQDMIQNSRGASYSQGYGDGCATGEKEAGFSEAQMQKDTRKYLTKSKYKEGWDDGYKECFFRRRKILEREKKGLS